MLRCRRRACPPITGGGWVLVLKAAGFRQQQTAGALAAMGRPDRASASG